ncbi:Exostosin-3 [Oopsacas minuta]|uniref:Exostosin-3 n=1 Tax=Oopsacas minuta TaxID=111878 RepID=A0AAV7JKH5_9METZ|nr:Exostosin-3 [Oopsacas minuta]
MFGTEENKYILTNSSICMADEAFKTVPSLFAQLYTIHGLTGGVYPFRDGYLIPCVYVLLSAKSLFFYRKMWKTLKDVCPTSNPQHLIVDFEKAAINTFREFWTSTFVLGCFLYISEMKIRYNPLLICGAVSLFLLLCLCYYLVAGRRTDVKVIQLTPLSHQHFSELTSKEKTQIGELESIKLSVRNEMRMLEKERLELANEIVTKKSQLIKITNQVKSTQKQLNIERENLRMLSISRQQVSNIHKGNYQSDHREINSPIYILERAIDTNDIHNTIVDRMDSYGSCSMCDCFDTSACSVLYEPAVYLLKDQQSDNSLTQLIDVFTLNSALQVLEGPAAACFTIALTLSSDLDSVITQLHTSNVWVKTSHSILLIQLLDSDSSYKYSLPSSLPSRVLLASPLKQMRPGYDMLIPPLLSLDDLLQHQLDTWSELPLLLPLHRNYLIYFSGYYDGTTPLLSHLEQLSSSLKTAVSIQLSCPATYSSSKSWSICGDQQTRLNSNRDSMFSIIPVDTDSEGIHAQLVRLIEALYTGAVPVVCGDEISLPYSEVIDWSKAVLHVPRNRLHEIHYLIRQVSDDQVFSYKKQGRFIWINYFSSAYHTLLTCVTLLFSRLSLPPPSIPSYTPEVLYPPEDSLNSPYEIPWRWHPLLSQRSLHWDSPPGAYFSVHPTPWQQKLTNSMHYEQGYSPSFPISPHVAQASGITSPIFQEFLLGNSPIELFTAVILTYKRQHLLLELLSRLRGVSFLHKVIVVWNDPDDVGDIELPVIQVPILIVRGSGNSLNNRFLPYDHIETEAVLSLDDDINLGKDDIQFAFRVWRENRDRLVGFPARFHIWDIHNNKWLYNSNYTCEISMVLTGAAFIHKYYLYLYSNWLPSSIRRTVDEFMNCEDIAMNFLIAHITRKPPIKVTSRWTFNCEGCTSLYNDENHFSERHKCVNKFVHEFGYMPLMYTQYRADSVLYRMRKFQCYQDI